MALFVYCVIATSSYLTLEIYAGFRPEESQIFLAKIRTWISTHTDQVIIIGSLPARILAYRQQHLLHRHLIASTEPSLGSRLPG